jgi:short-subunit dehydrogenase
MKQKAIVIGASSGIGYELSKLLVERNYRVGIVARRIKPLNALKQENPSHYLVLQMDIVQKNCIDKLQNLVQDLGGLDLLIFSAGIGEINTKLDREIEHRTNRLNVIGFTQVIGWAFNYFCKSGRGHLAAITSVAGIRGSKDAPAYNASKAYQINYLEGLRNRVHTLKIPVSITDIRPGFVDTRMAKGDGLFWVAPVEKAAAQIMDIVDKKKPVGYVTKR